MNVDLTFDELEMVVDSLDDAWEAAPADSPETEILMKLHATWMREFGGKE